MTPPLKGQPVTAADCDAEWIALRRDIIAHEGRAVRAGEAPTIEIKTIAQVEHLAAHDPLRANAWCVLALPNEATCFATAADRDAVLQQLQQPLR